jgi:hypothetical protein
MSSTQSLPTVVEALDDKAKKQKQAENTQFHVSVARHNIRAVNSELDALIASLRDLQYYKTVFEEGFDGSAPTLVSSAAQSAKKAIESTQEKLLEDVQSGLVDDGETELGSDNDRDNLEVELTPKITKQISQIQSAKQMVDNVTEQIEGQLESKRTTWSTKVSAAEELQKILGGQDGDFAHTLNHMHTLLTRELMDSSGSASNFVSQWTNAVSNWEQHQSLQSFDDFQEKHGLSDSTVADVKTLSQSQQLTLADVSLGTIEEMKRVDELESAIELSL